MYNQLTRKEEGDPAIRLNIEWNNLLTDCVETALVIEMQSVDTNQYRANKSLTTVLKLKERQLIQGRLIRTARDEEWFAVQAMKLKDDQKSLRIKVKTLPHIL